MVKDTNKISSSFLRMRARYERKRNLFQPPAVACQKCGAKLWELDGTEWYCFTCGNRGQWINGYFKQQIQ